MPSAGGTQYSERKSRGLVTNSSKLEGMATLAFVKAHGAGNDFIVVEARAAQSIGCREDDLADLAIRICNRRFGVGADGLEVVDDSCPNGVAVRARLWNSDGSEAEISGNGTRCVAAYLVDRGLGEESFSIETGAGVKSVQIVGADPPAYEFRMVSQANSCRILDSSITLNAGDRDFVVTTVDVGNPQCVCRVESFEFDWASSGAALERHECFPNGTNVSFVKVARDTDSSSILEARFWERGAGATLSSGTGTLGAAIAARHGSWIEGDATVRTQGGDLVVDWDEGIGLTGPARITARGVWEAGRANVV